MNKKIEQEDYIFNKLITSILFDVDRNFFDSENNIHLFTGKILVIIKDIIQQLLELDALNDEVKSNIYNFLSEVRNVCSDKSSIDNINQIIVLLNKSQYDINNIFYRLELRKRCENNKYLECSNDIIERNIPSLNWSIVNDFLVLRSHGSKISNEEFTNVWLPRFTGDAYYYESINAILDEYPEMFEDRTFYNRFLSIVKANKELDDKDKFSKLIKKKSKKIERKVKKYK